MPPIVYHNVSYIRDVFKSLLMNKEFVSINREGTMTSLVGSETIEILNASFIADEESIFGEVNWDYVQREEEWYYSQSLNVNDIPGGAPKIWAAVADKDGFINSNYGWCIFSKENYSQYDNVLKELIANPGSRRATCIYTRPSMWEDYNKNGRSDFCCTNSVGYYIRQGKVHAKVNMRSNDAWAGYRNDRAWQLHVLEKLTADLNAAGNNYEVGNLFWNVDSLHVYARNFYLVDHYTKTGDIHIGKAEYQEKYPHSDYR